MPSAQTGRCRRCGGPLGAGSQQGVCLDCIKKLHAAKQARESGRSRPSSRRAAADSAKRESVRTFTCVDCGESYFDVDMAEKRIVMVDGQPVCATCLKKRTGMGLMPIFVGSGLVVVALLYLYPLQVLVGLGICGVCAILTGAYYSRWAGNTRATIVGVGLAAVVVVAVAHTVVSGAMRRAADADAIGPYYAACQKAVDDDNDFDLIENFNRAKEFAKTLNYPDEQKAALARWNGVIEKRRGSMDPLDRDLFAVLTKKLPQEKRFGKLPVKKVTHERLQAGGVAFEIEMFARKDYDTDAGRVQGLREIRTLLTLVLVRPMHVASVSVKYFVIDDGEEREIAHFGLDLEGYAQWKRNSFTKADGTLEGPGLETYCKPAEWRP